MDGANEKQTRAAEVREPELRSAIREALQEYLAGEQARAEPAHKAELADERRRRESLEKRVNELIEENRRARQAAEEAERHSAIRSELQRLGVTKIDLAHKAVKDDIQRAEDGRIVARSSGGEISLREYLTQFLSENPELLPARVAGGSGAGAQHKPPLVASPVIDLESIRPGMPPEELERVRREIARVAAQNMKSF